VHDCHGEALEDAGLPDMPRRALRHTAAASWLGTGRSLDFVRAQLGHSSINVTSDSTPVRGGRWRDCGNGGFGG
jgi:integrase